MKRIIAREGSTCQTLAPRRQAMLSTTCKPQASGHAAVIDAASFGPLSGNHLPGLSAPGLRLTCLHADRSHTSCPRCQGHSRLPCVPSEGIKPPWRPAPSGEGIGDGKQIGGGFRGGPSRQRAQRSPFRSAGEPPPAGSSVTLPLADRWQRQTVRATERRQRVATRWLAYCVRVWVVRCVPRTSGDAIVG